MHSSDRPVIPGVHVPVHESVFYRAGRSRRMNPVAIVRNESCVHLSCPLMAGVGSRCHD